MVAGEYITSTPKQVQPTEQSSRLSTPDLSTVPAPPPLPQLSLLDFHQNQPTVCSDTLDKIHTAKSYYEALTSLDRSCKRKLFNDDNVNMSPDKIRKLNDFSTDYLKSFDHVKQDGEHNLVQIGEGMKSDPTGTSNTTKKMTNVLPQKNVGNWGM